MHNKDLYQDGNQRALLETEDLVDGEFPAAAAVSSGQPVLGRPTIKVEYLYRSKRACIFTNGYLIAVRRMQQPINLFTNISTPHVYLLR